MVKPLLIAFLFLLASLYTKSQVVYSDDAFTGPEILPTTNNQTVYISLGQTATTYHSVANCVNIGSSKAGIAYTDENTAAYTYRRKPCCHCWANAISDCTDGLAADGGLRTKLFQRIWEWRAGTNQLQVNKKTKP